MYIDTHCHLDDPKLICRESEVVGSFLAAGVEKVINIGCTAETSRITMEQAERYPAVFFAAGVHPSDVSGYNEEGEEEILRLADHKKCVAIGEIGLDYHYPPVDKELQKRCFIRQIEIAKQKKLPLSIHVRDAMGDAIAVLKEQRANLVYGGVMHCYSGSKESAAILLDMGLYFAFGGTVTFKNASNIPKVAAYIPEDRILTETDSPYLAPEGKRGTVNEPANIPIILEKLALIRNTDKEALAAAVMKNALTLFPKLKT